MLEHYVPPLCISVPHLVENQAITMSVILSLKESSVCLEWDVVPWPLIWAYQMSPIIIQTDGN